MTALFRRIGRDCELGPAGLFALHRLGEQRASRIAAILCLVYAADIIYGYFVRGL